MIEKAKVTEILSLPGGGKTTLSQSLSFSKTDRVSLIKGRSSIKRLSQCTNFRDYAGLYSHLALRVTCWVLTPFVLIIFRRYLVALARSAADVRLSEASNSRFFVYVVGILNYQLIRYLAGSLFSLATGKTVIIDEGFLYNSIRLQTFTNPAVRAQLNDALMQDLKPFKIDSVWLKINPEVAARRYFRREAGTNSDLNVTLKNWQFDTSQKNWWNDAWLQMDLWLAQLANVRNSKVVTANEDLDCVVGNFPLI